MEANIKALAAGLSTGPLAERRAAAEKLAQLGPLASPAAVALVRACGDDDESLREWAVAALEAIESAPSPALRELCELLAAQPLVGYWAATLLGRMGGQAAPAVPALAAALDAKRDLSVRERAAWALGQIGPAAAAARQALQQAASSGEPRLARLAEQALANF